MKLQYESIWQIQSSTSLQASEYNKNKDKWVKFLQIWVFPNKENAKPRYDQIVLKPIDRHNRLQQILSPNPDDDTIDNTVLNERDGLGTWNTDKISIKANSQDAEILLMEVPMN